MTLRGPSLPMARAKMLLGSTYFLEASFWRRRDVVPAAKMGPLSRRQIGLRKPLATFPPLGTRKFSGRLQILYAA